MTFEEWIKARHMNGIYFGDLKAAWEAAVEVEREACAKICEEKHVNGNWKYDTRHECAEAIRERSNDAANRMDATPRQQESMSDE